MAYSLLDRTGQTVDMRRQRAPQHEHNTIRERATGDDNHLEFERAQMKFHTEVSVLIKEAVEQANARLAKGPERYSLCEMSGCYAGPFHVRRSACNPISYELRGGGRKSASKLLVELTRDGMIDASLVPRPPTPEVPRTSTDLGWQQVPSRKFSATTAADLVAWYLAAITRHAR
jgi:hypothetical protein